jgi:hydrocephalus-inducing protein
LILDAVTHHGPVFTLIQCLFFQCDSPDVFVQLPIRVASDSEQSVEIWFRPLARLRKVPATLTLFSPELGDFRYSLELTGSSLPNERTLRFDTSLGSEHVQTFRFTSFEMAACEFECKIGGNEFRVDQARVKAQGAARGSEGETLSVDVRYEPTNLGDVRDELVITPLNGKGSAEYRVPLYGHCDPPKPLGPFVIRPGQPVRVDFKNVFANAETFTYSVDNASFVISKRSTLIQPKGTDVIEVSLNVPGGAAPAAGKDKKKDAAAAASAAAAPVVAPSGKPMMAKLMVSCPNMPPWIYYLRAM